MVKIMKVLIMLLMISTLLTSVISCGEDNVSPVHLPYTPATPESTPYNPITPEPTTSIQGPYPESHLKFLNIYEDEECTKPITLFDFGSVPYGYSRGVTLPIYMKNLTDSSMYVTADSDEWLICLDVPPPKWYTERDIKPNSVEEFLLSLDIISTPPPQESYFEVTINVELEQSGEFVIVFPAKFVIT